MKKKDIISGIMVILAITLLSGGLLSQVFNITKPRIEEQRRLEQERLNREIFPEGDNFTESEENGLQYTVVFDSEGNRIGSIFRVAQGGYGGPVIMRVGLDTDLSVKGVRILEHGETPGLGANITAESFLRQFEGKSGDALNLRQYHRDGTVDAITGATVSSRAVADGIIRLREKLEDNPARSIPGLE